MPPLSGQLAHRIVKMLLVGDSGRGKTGALASLAEAGYNIRILDFDNGSDIIIGAVEWKFGKGTDETKEILDRVDAVPLVDPIKFSTGRPLRAESWSHAKKLLDGKEEWAAYGPITEWTSNDILVVDSLTACGDRIMNHVLAMNNRLGARSGEKGGKEVQHWGQAMEEEELFMMGLCDDEIHCNVIVNSHIVGVTDESEEFITWHPSALGSKLPPKIPRHFNTMLKADKVGSGAGERLVIKLKGDRQIGCKLTALDLPTELPQATALRQVFKAIRGTEPMES